MDLLPAERFGEKRREENSVTEMIFNVAAITAPTVGLLALAYTIDRLLILASKQSRRRRGKAA